MSTGGQLDGPARTASHSALALAPGLFARVTLAHEAAPDIQRPVEERELVHRKAYLLHEQTVGQASEDPELLDQDSCCSPNRPPAQTRGPPPPRRPPRHPHSR